MLAALALAVSLVAAGLLWKRPDELQAALAVLAGLIGLLLGAGARRRSTSNTGQFLGLAATVLGGGVAVVLLSSVIYLVLRTFFAGGPGIGL